MSGRVDFDPGSAGASSRREYERRRANRERQVRERHPRIGNLLLKLQEAPAHEKAWATGAAGEEELAASLTRRCPDVIFLHDRRIPGSRANIDHIAIAPSGVYVIDAKRYRGKIEVRKPLFGEPKLLIAGRDKTKLVEDLARQAEAVSTALAPIAPEVPVHGCFCFLNPEGPLASSELPLLRTLRINGYPLLYPRKLAKRLNEPGTVHRAQQQLVAERLAQVLVPA